MIYQVSLTSRCELAIAESALWWADHRDLDQAMRWFDGIHQSLATLRENPERFSVIHEQSIYHWKHTYHQLLFGLGNTPTHRAVYRIQDDTVSVITVRHVSQRDFEPSDLES